jgi:hypothetical protein
MTFGQSLTNFLIDEPATVGQVCLTSVQLWLGEWYQDTSQGLPYLEDVLGKHEQTTSDQAIQDYILGIQGVVDITAFQSAQNRMTRNYVAQLRIVTAYSETELEVINQTNF